MLKLPGAGGKSLPKEQGKREAVFSSTHGKLLSCKYYLEFEVILEEEHWCQTTPPLFTVPILINHELVHQEAPVLPSEWNPTVHMKSLVTLNFESEYGSKRDPKSMINPSLP